MLSPPELRVNSLKTATNNLNTRANVQVGKSLYGKIIHKYKDKVENMGEETGQEKNTLYATKTTACIHPSFSRKGAPLQG